MRKNGWLTFFDIFDIGTAIFKKSEFLKKKKKVFLQCMMIGSGIYKIDIRLMFLRGKVGKMVIEKVI